MTIADERDKAFIDAVVNDKWDGVRKYSKKYDITIPKNKKVVRAGIYKAVQYCTEIPEDVKTLAMVKCLKLGFSPLIAPPMQEGGDTE